MNKISRFLYENSVLCQTYLIIPFVAYRIDGHNIYSYSLLAEEGYKNALHQATNPAKLYSNNLANIINIAQEHLEDLRDINHSSHQSLYFYQRYIYNNNLIILHKQAEKCFYDHYSPHELKNIAAPKLFKSSFACLNWVRKGLDRSQVN